MRRLVTILGLLLSAAVIAWIATRFDLGAAWQNIVHAHWGWVVAGTFVYMLAFPVRGLRWKILLRSVAPVSTQVATEVFLVGSLANNVMPARLGDVARALVLKQRTKIPGWASLSSVFLERIFDGLTVVAFLTAVLWVAPPEGVWVRSVSTLTGLTVLVALGLCFVLAHLGEARLDRLLGLLPHVLKSKMSKLVHKLAQGLHSLKSAKDVTQVILLSVIIWILEVAAYVVVAKAFALQIGPLGMTLVMAILALGLSAPSAPGFVGVFEGLIIQALSLYAVVGPEAVAFAVTLHLVHFVPGTLLGLAAAWRSGLHLSDVSRAAEGDGEGLTREPSAVR